MLYNIETVYYMLHYIELLQFIAMCIGESKNSILWPTYNPQKLITQNLASQKHLSTNMTIIQSSQLRLRVPKNTIGT